MEDINKIKPFIKWVGGKGQLLNQLDVLLPTDFLSWKDTTYIEPFVGGGAMLFYMLKNYSNIKRAIINDINPDLITCYKVVRDSPKELIDALEILEAQYLSIKTEAKQREFFLNIRTEYNCKQLQPIDNSSRFIFLNKTCFNGLYRVNKSGYFNVPFGKYKNPRICDTETILNDSKILQHVEILNGDFEEKYLKEATLLTKGLAASSGVAVGRIMFDAKRVKIREKTILVREETSPEDLQGMALAQGIVTLKGGATSHGAVVARGMGKCCVTGCSEIKIDEVNKTMTVGKYTLKEGDFISVSGHTGEIYLGKIPLKENSFSDELKEFVSWASKIKRMGVRMNADTPEDVEQGKAFGAKGIGLCRTEHMFFKKDKIWTIREFILSDRGEEKEKALEKLHNLQKEDFLNIFKILDGDEANIRLLDPPVHEFLPKTLEDKKKMAEILSISLEDIEKRIYRLKDENPMLGHRGCRLGVSYPELYRIQARAIVEAAYECEKKGIKVHPEIMIPFIMESKELAYLRKEIEEEIESFFKEVGATVKYKLGTMIEIPRACLLANEIAEYADFFSFGTNDLTQMSMGLSRDDSVKFLDDYREKGIWEGEPFYSIDTKAVTKLVEIGVKNGKSAKPNLQIGVCGEHGGDPKSIEFFEGQKFDYVSCSPFRVPTAILAAAQSYLKLKK